jgi:hypothetical protein
MLIHPWDYAEWLAGAWFVELEVYIKMCVNFGPWLHADISWRRCIQMEHTGKV